MLQTQTYGVPKKLCLNGVSAVTPATIELLRQLSAQPALREMRLVGGTALALQYGHRQSVYLDFFGRFTTSQEELIDLTRTIGNISILNQTSHILQMTINQIKVDFVDYSRYEWIDQPLTESTIVLASDKDIAAMKVNAIMGRGTKKDFVDMYLLLQHYSLAEILQFYKQKYPEYSDYRALLSLTYFEDAELQPMPRMFIPDQWDQMKKSIIQAVKDYQHNL